MSKLSVSSSFFLPVHRTGVQYIASRRSSSALLLMVVGGVLGLQTSSNLIGQFLACLRMREVPWSCTSWLSDGEAVYCARVLTKFERSPSN